MDGHTECTLGVARAQLRSCTPGFGCLPWHRKAGTQRKRFVILLNSLLYHLFYLGFETVLPGVKLGLVLSVWISSARLNQVDRRLFLIGHH